MIDTALLKAITGDRKRPSYVPPPQELPVDRTLDLVAASLAGGMIAVGGKVLTAEEAVGVFREVRASLLLS